MISQNLECSGESTGAVLDSEAVAAAVRDERVDQHYARAQVDQPPRQVGADESEAAGDEDETVGVGVEVGHGMMHH